MFDRAETIRQLEESLRLLERAVAATPERWHRPAPGEEAPPDFWGVAMNLAHLAVYEERIAAPVLEALADGGDAADAIRPGATADWEEREAAELSREPLGRSLERLRAARAADRGAAAHPGRAVRGAGDAALGRGARHGAQVAGLGGGEDGAAHLGAREQRHADRALPPGLAPGLTTARV